MLFLITIVPSDHADDYYEFYDKLGISAAFSSVCHGTAIQSTLDYLGIENTSKTMIFSLTTREVAKKAMSRLITEMGIVMPGRGIALTLPVGSVGGSSALEYLLDGQEKTEKEQKEMTEFKYSLLIVIAEKGSTDTVMDAARKQNARGGTVIHAKGTGAKFASKFLGVSIADEKEMILIVTKKQDKDAIMLSIMEEAGMHTESKAAVIALPVEDIAGLRSVTEE